MPLSLQEPMGDETERPLEEVINDPRAENPGENVDQTLLRRPHRRGPALADAAANARSSNSASA